MPRFLRNLKNALCPQGNLPVKIYLPALEEAWILRYRKTVSGTVQARCDGRGNLVVTGCIQSVPGVHGALQRWMSRRARGTLVPWLEELGWEHGLTVGKVSVRGQRTRWGSCSSTGTINLNWKLLFLPPDVVRYILLHELCHTVHMDHSPRFWALLASAEPHYRIYRSAARAGMKHVPVWAR